MRQGTAPRHIFSLPFEASELKTIQITYAQQGKLILQKQTADCTREGRQISVRLTQEETFRFDPGYKTAVQLRALMSDGTPVASGIKFVAIQPSLDKEVLT